MNLEPRILPSVTAAAALWSVRSFIHSLPNILRPLAAAPSLNNSPFSPHHQQRLRTLALAEKRGERLVNPSDPVPALLLDPPSETLDMPPRSSKRRKTAPVKYLCQACDKERVETAFPDYNPSPDCDHLINICKGCLKAWTNAQIEGSLFATGDDGKIFGIKCPQCPALMRNVNIEIATTQKPYALFEKAERVHIANTTPNWRWCLAPGCKAGQVHASPTPKTSKKSKGKAAAAEVKPDILTCNECGAKACVTCDRPWHEGETCSDYQERVKDRLEEEVRGLKGIHSCM